MSYYTNILNYPEKHGLTLVAEVELSEPCWSFDTLAVWKDDEGFYLGTDSGCSCPMPFESHTRDALTGPLTKEQAVEEANNLKSVGYEPEYDKDGFTTFLRAIEDA